MGKADLEKGDTLLARQRPESYPHPVGAIRIVETHISWVLLTGTWAYKIKKPVDLGFLDFTTLDARRRYCEEELRLNRRLAPGIYDAVVEIRGTLTEPRIEGAGRVLEYAVKMCEFPQEALASEMLSHNSLTSAHVDRLAAGIAAFHDRAARAGGTSPFGMPEAVLTPALDNFETLEACLDRAMARSGQTLRDWTRREFAKRQTAFETRRSDGFVRECHGDLHLRNIVVLDGEPVAFDCIEFDERLRWIDVMSEVAFVLMDFEDRGHRDFGWRFLNAYLEATGDYAGLAVLRFYLVYRALVRAKVHALRAGQSGVDDKERQRLDRAACQYVALAERHTSDSVRAVIITHGVSGSGKTTATQSLIETAGAVRVRSDIERKRLHGLAPLARTRSVFGTGIYSGEATRATYDRLLQATAAIVEAGYPAVVDAAFLRRSEREPFRAFAERSGAGFVILAFEAPRGILRERVTRRLGAGADPSEANLDVLERQLDLREALKQDEERSAIRVEPCTAAAPDYWRSVVERAAGTVAESAPRDPE